MKLKQCICALFLFACFPLPTHATEATDVFELVGERLALMKQVAAWKWANDKAIEDPDREAVVLARTTETATRAGLTGDSARAFFEVQIEAAREVQRFWFRRFRDIPSERPDRPPDLDTVTRPQLIELGDRIIQAAKAAGPLDDSMTLRHRFFTIVKVPGLSDETRGRLYEALIDVEPFANRLDQILATGEIRIGTTGDYAPFSSGEGQRFTGIDIDLARDLADSLGVKAVFVQTSWPSLMDDLAGDKFDIGMSGISRTLARQRFAFFSSPYHSGGKTPIARCADVERYDTLAEIDQPDVEVIVNPGGTNQRFASTALERASVRIFDDNRTIFDEIAAGRADVMITDAIEVRLKASQYPELCATMPGKTLTFQEKGYLMPRDRVLLEYVNAWLAERIADGTLRAVFDQHLSGD